MGDCDVVPFEPHNVLFERLEFFWHSQLHIRFLYNTAKYKVEIIILILNSFYVLSIEYRHLLMSLFVSLSNKQKMLFETHRFKTHCLAKKKKSVIFISGWCF